MKLTLQILFFCFIFSSSTSILQGQHDTLKSQEIRFTLLGKNDFPNIRDKRLDDRKSIINPTISYLRQIKSSKYYFISQLSASYNNRVRFNGEDLNSQNGISKDISLFIGIEKQTKFKHFGIFASLGFRGGLKKFNGDFNFENEPVTDFTASNNFIGIAGQITPYTNIADNLYFYFTTLVSFEHQDIDYNKPLNDECCRGFNGFNHLWIIGDSFGLAYKF